MNFPPSLPFHRSHLFVWRTGGHWCLLIERWLEHLVSVHGAERFRTRKKAREVKELCDEGLVLARWLRNSPDVHLWKGRFNGPGAAADAVVRESPASPLVNVQIVSAFDGERRAAQMLELNKKKVISGYRGSVTGYVARQTRLVISRIHQKTRKSYPPDFWLLVSVEDALPGGLSEMSKLVTVATAEAVSSSFQRMYLVGTGSRNQVVRIK